MPAEFVKPLFLREAEKALKPGETARPGRGIPAA